MCATLWLPAPSLQHGWCMPHCGVRLGRGKAHSWRRAASQVGGYPNLFPQVVLMSATLDSDLFARYFGGCPVLAAGGRTFPVEHHFLEARGARRLSNAKPAYVRGFSPFLGTSVLHAGNAQVLLAGHC